MKTSTNLALAAIISFAVLNPVPAFAKPAADPRLPATQPPIDQPAIDDNNRIQIALLLDTSNSMDGLIDQARTQLWKVVNTFIDAKRNGKTPFVEVALYEYGNNNNAIGNDWIRLISPMTRDLDGLSNKLFELKTNGGDEYCGAVIQRSLVDLAWDQRDSVYKAIFIAGNEPFNAGRVDYRSACKEALAKNISVNTIHCGNRQEGINGSWHDGAAIGGGDFLVIDQDIAAAHINAPQDKKIAELSLELNKTYLGYGKQRKEAAANQQRADNDAETNAGVGASVQRALTKSSDNYSNAAWDLVDALRENKIDPAELKIEELPEEMKALSPQARKEFIENAAARRSAIQTKIKTLNEEREAHVAAELKKHAEVDGKTLDQAIIEATRKQAGLLGYEFKD
ncbi:MAG: VWA domain-containing protein [Armatimonadetes bacterium]|nr:VWA domain-containing protein [Akkermansiaceae bacterium]